MNIELLSGNQVTSDLKVNSTPYYGFSNQKFFYFDKSNNKPFFLQLLLISQCKMK